MYVIMDMGTTNTRLYMCANNQVVDHIKGNFGASFGKRNGRLELCKRVGSLLNDLLDRCAVKECDMEIRTFVDKHGCNGFEVFLGGDCELETTIRALKFITRVLEDESKEVYD